MGAGTADVVVVGGGIVGAAAAAFLASAGATVVLVEREGIAAAASGRNSGVVQQPLDPVLARLHTDTVALYRRLDPGDGFVLPPSPAGLLYVTRRPELAARLAAELARTHPQHEPSYVAGPALLALEPSLAPDVAACRLEIGYPVAPAAATRSYAALAERAGARLVIGEAEVATTAGVATGVRVGGASLSSGAVVVAAGPWTPALVDPSGRWRPIRPLWGVVVELALAVSPRHVLEEAAIDEAIEPADRGHEPARLRRPTHADDPASGEAVAFSLVTAGGTSVLGSTFLDREPVALSLVPALRDRGARFVPAIRDATLGRVRRCARPLSADGLPMVGEVPWLPGLFVAAGHGPWGISTGPATARIVADAVLGKHPAIPAALHPARFGAP